MLSSGAEAGGAAAKTGHLRVSCTTYTTYKLDTETEVSTRFRNSRARGCSVPSAARALLRARGFLNAWIPLVEVSKYFRL